MKSVDTIISKVGNYCSKSGYMGWDPYDGLNSKIFHLNLPHIYGILEEEIHQLNKTPSIHLQLEKASIK